MTRKYYTKADQNEIPYLEEIISNEETTQKQTLGKYISSVIADRIGDVVHKSKTGGQNWQSEEAELLRKESVAHRLGISVKMLDKKLYHWDTSREWIIAICAAYGLDAKQTSEACTHYDWPSLDIEAPREAQIEKYLDGLNGIPTSLDAFNKNLISKKMRPLQIQKRHTGSRTTSKTESHFTQISKICLRTYGFEGDPYESLETKYFPTHRVTASMLVKSPDGKIFELFSSSNGTLYYHELEANEAETCRYRTSANVFCKTTSVNHPDFGQFYLDLISKVKRKMRRYDDLLNDSRNYQGRFSANLKEYYLHAFYEEYNYDFPERSEYYLMEYWKGEYSLSISHHSMFMQEYLSEDEYYQYFQTRDRINRKKYSSVEEIETLLKNKSNRRTESLLKARKNTFLKLRQLLMNKISEIQDRKIFIRNFDKIWNIPADVLRYFSIEEIFKCEYDPKYREISNHLNEVTVEAGTENEMVLTFDDIRIGFECGFNSFTEICNYKRSHASIADALI